MAKLLECDVLVIGAGPAGSRAAMRAASEGLEVVLVDSKTRLGERPHCGEFVPYQIFSEFSLNRGSIVHKINNLETLLVENRLESRFKSNLIQSSGFIVDRPKFDRYMAIEAAISGALTMSSTTFSAFTDKGCIVKSSRDEFLVEAKFIIAADGARSSVRKKLGLLTADCVEGRQFETIISNTCSSNAMVFLDQEFFCGYGWLFPKGTTGNIGVGLLPKDGLASSESLENFREMLLKMGLIKPGWIARTSGFIPAFGIRFPVIVDNILFVGDAAGLAHPITGAGIAPAVYSGDVAGDLVAKAVKSGNSSIVSKYQDVILYRYGGSYKHALSKRRIQLESWESKDFAELCNRTWISFKGYKKRERQF
ncbi:MAG: NAD(P)/FAD-dependent oxidoreductase [Desulfomonilaceae bacterium]